MVLKSDGRAKINNVSIWTHIIGSHIEDVRLFILIERQE